MIHLLFTGGTISMQRDARAGGNVPAHDGAALVALAPELPAVAPFTVEDWGRYPACHMGPDTLWALRSRVAAVQGGGAARGIVVTHGTDTLEETAYLLGRTLDPAVPVVLTGAMRTSSEAGWDGPRNLTDAARVAADPASRGRGAMVVFAGKIFDGRTVAKVQATALDAFAAPHGAPIGEVAEGRVTFHAAAGPRTPLAPAGLSARVALVPLTLGDDGAVLDLLRPTHDGVVLGAFGSGNLPPGALPAIERWIGEGKPVVLGSRCLFGEVSPAYAFPGGGATVVRLGAVPAGPRTLAQARLELALALAAGVPYGAGA
ncbi:MAG: asparaginase [Gemmatimonadetes bacterium]|nr:asparaginase [Gemmatimonadota bacterium]